MADTSVTVTYDHVYAATAEKTTKVAHRQVFYKHPLMYWLDKVRPKGGRKEDGSGRDGKIERRVTKTRVYGTKTWGRGTTFDSNDPELYTIAKYRYGQLGMPLTRYYEDELENSGEAQIINEVTDKMSVALDSMREDVALQMVETTPGTRHLWGPLYYVREDPTADLSIAEINQSTNTWWRNQTSNMTGLAAVSHLDKYMFDLMLTCGQWGSIDYIICSTDVFSLYNDVTTDDRIITSNAMGDAAFKKLGYKGIPLVVDYDFPSGTLLMVDSSAWEWQPDPRCYFKWQKFERLPNGVDKQAQLLVRAQLLCTKRRSQGILYNIAA